MGRKPRRWRWIFHRGDRILVPMKQAVRNLMFFAAGGLGLLWAFAPGVGCAKEAAMKLLSGAFSDGAKMPFSHVKQGAGGENVSPPLAWEHPPAGTRSFALTVVDPHPVARNWVHWIVVDIPAGVNTLPEKASGENMPEGARELVNSFGETGYGGPQPPAGSGDHPYVFTIYALDTAMLPLSERTTLVGFLKAIEGHVLGKGELTGYFGR